MKVDEHNRFRLHENGTATITKRRSAVGNPYFPHCLNYNEDDYHKTRVETGKQTKSFSIDSRIYRKIASSAVRMWNHREDNIIFLTLTFPSDITGQKANKCFSKYIDNLEHNYHLNAHIAVREFKVNQDHPDGQYHFHCMFDIPFNHVKKLNEAWCHAFSEYFPGSPNALRLGSPKHGNIVYSVNRMVKYMCKYMTKSKDQEFSSRCYFLSHNITSRPKDIDYNDFQALTQEYESKIYHCDYCTIVTFLDTTREELDFWGWFRKSHQNQVDFPLKTCFNSTQVA